MRAYSTLKWEEHRAPGTDLGKNKNTYYLVIGGEIYLEARENEVGGKVNGRTQTF